MTTFGYTLKDAKLESVVVQKTFHLSYIEETSERQVRYDIESYIQDEDNFCDYARILSIRLESDYWVVVIEDYKL